MKANPLTEEQAKEAEAKGAAARVMRQQHGLSIAPWEVAGLDDASASEEDLRYRELRERWDAALVPYGDENTKETIDPLAMHRRVGAFFARAWRLAWALMEIERAEWTSSPIAGLHVSKMAELPSAIAEQDLPAIIAKIHLLKHSVPGATGASAPVRGFPFDVVSEVAKVAQQGEEIRRELTQIQFSHGLLEAEHVNEIASLMTELDGRSALEAFDAPTGGPSNEMPVVMRRLAALAAVSAAIVTRKPISEIFVDSFIYPARYLKVPKAVRWTTMQPPRTGTPRGYPVGKGGQFDALKIAGAAVAAARLGITAKVLDMATEYGQQGHRLTEQQIKGAAVLGLLGAASLINSANNAAMKLYPRDEAEHVSAAAGNEAYSLVPVQAFISISLEVVDRAVQDLRLEPGVSSGVARLAAVVYLQKGQTEQARALCAKLALELQAALYPDMSLIGKVGAVS